MLLHSLPNVVFFSTSDRTCTDVREEEKTKYWFPIKFWPAAVSDVTQPPSSADTVWAGPACITRASEIFFPRIKSIFGTDSISRSWSG